jgi:exonuclease VII small subunit
MKEGKKDKNYEKNYNILIKIAEEIENKDIAIDELIKKGEIASEAAKVCIEILNQEKAKFKKLEEELKELESKVEN